MDFFFLFDEGQTFKILFPESMLFCTLGMEGIDTRSAAFLEHDEKDKKIHLMSTTAVLVYLGCYLGDS